MDYCLFGDRELGSIRTETMNLIMHSISLCSARQHPVTHPRTSKRHPIFAQCPIKVIQAIQAIQVAEGEVEVEVEGAVVGGMDTTAIMVPMVPTVLPVVTLLTPETRVIQEVLEEEAEAEEAGAAAVDLAVLAAVIPTVGSATCQIAATIAMSNQMVIEEYELFECVLFLCLEIVCAHH